MRQIIIAVVALWAVTCAHAEALPPIADGSYTFAVRFAEQPNMSGGNLDVQIHGRHIRATSTSNSSFFPLGIVDDGVLLWHSASKQWIIGQNAEDAEAPEVGGCSEGPFVVDLKKKIFWTC